MRFQIYSGETPIGQSDLDKIDSSMGIATGKFLPTENYKNVQPVFHLYIEATIDAAGQSLEKQEMIGRYYQERDNLHLTVRVPNGETVPVQWVHVEDFSAELDEISVTVAVRDYQTFSRYFDQETMP